MRTTKYILVALLLLVIGCSASLADEVPSPGEEASASQKNDTPPRADSSDASTSKGAGSHQTSTHNTSLVDDAEREAARRARRARVQIDRRRDGAAASRALLRQGATDGCDWRLQPLAYVKGRMCGSHYKVLGLDRASGDIDKSRIKKAFRQRSLSVHPDKNPAVEADAAFKLAQSAYDCLSDDLCKEEYDTALNVREEIIAEQRRRFKRKALSTGVQSAKKGYYYVSVAANYVYNMGVDVWNFAGEFEVDVLGTEGLPVGRVALMAGLLLKGRMLLQLQSMAYIVMRINYEIAKAHGVI